ncbi:MAG TPA: RluA family pseudouridine synthase, partial [Thermopetrobacter sp.]|nr:RluA family pseudouridine synthase [Thermopetrobacter sp.]
MTDDAPDIRSFRVPPDEAGGRLDRWLAERLADLSRGRVQSLIADGRVRVNDRPASRAGWRLKAGDVIEVAIPPPTPAAPEAQDIPLAVVHEDDHLIVIDKPAGLVVHPAAGHEDGTLVNALLHHCGGSLSGIGGVRRPGIVHRLDKDTSGLMVVAKSDAAHAGLAEQFAAHGRDGALVRRYLALVWGAPRLARGTVNAPLARATTNRKKIAVARPGDGREAVTHYTVMERFPDRGEEAVAALLSCRLETGRTHQIRVHMAHLGHPLLGDATYGAGFASRAAKLSDAARAALAALNRQALHAAELGFIHPISGERLHFASPP